MQNITFKDFYKPTPYNEDTKNQIWLSQLADSHDNFCNCMHPFAHLLASIFPVGHKDRTLTINQILARDYIEKCHSGGEEGESHGMAGGRGQGDSEGIKAEEEEDLPVDEVEKLLAAAAVEPTSR